MDKIHTSHNAPWLVAENDILLDAIFWTQIFEWIESC